MGCISQCIWQGRTRRPLYNLAYLSQMPTDPRGLSVHLRAEHRNPPSLLKSLEISSAVRNRLCWSARMSCNGCRALRKGCSDDCVIRPCLHWISSPDSQANATMFLTKFYGRAGLINLITAGPVHLRPGNCSRVCKRRRILFPHIVCFSAWNYSGLSYNPQFTYCYSTHGFPIGIMS